MVPDVFMHDFTNSAEEETRYVILGRAFTLATRFESNCRALAMHLEIRQSPEMLAEPPEKQAAMLADIAKKKLVQHISYVAKYLVRLPGVDVEGLLQRAREARNTMAHEMAVGVIDMFRHEQNADAFVEWLKPFVEDIALADRVVCVALTVLNRDPLPNAEFLARYQSRLTGWVLSNESTSTASSE
jgi:hypothetical protein